MTPRRLGNGEKNEKHQFAQGELVPVVANKVGPYNNPTETYSYYSLPHCKPEDVEHHNHKLGEVLSGDRKKSTDYSLEFGVDVDWVMLCHKTLSEAHIKKFYAAIDRDYYFELFLDGLPIWGYLGEYDTDNLFLEHTSIARHFLYTHLHFDIGHNDNRVVAVNVSLGQPPSYVPKREELNKEMRALDVTFSYSVKWVQSKIKYKDRMERYREDEFLPHTIEVHWLSIINSFVLVILLTVFLSIVLVRVLKNNFTRYMVSPDDAELIDSETGWKLIHGDVFRHPQLTLLLAACAGVGMQLLLMAGLVVLLALLDVFDPVKRGNVLTALIVTYALTSGVGGYMSARLYKQLEGTNWVWNIIAAALLLPGPLCVTFAFLNTVAIYYKSTAAVPFSTIMVLLTLYLSVSFPLTLIGGIAGKNSTGKMEVPCRTKITPRELPSLPWYRSGWVQTFLAGFLPFSAIYIELHYIFASIWGHKMYTLFGILALAMTMLVLVTAFVTIAFTYFQLIAEDYQWWWRSFFSGGSTGIFVFIYCFYYFFHRSEMEGFFQTSFYFGYMATLAYMFVLALGSLGFYSALYFVHYIYGAIKTE